MSFDSFLSSAQKAQLDEQMTNLHATFARPLYVYKSVQRVVETNSPEHVFIWENSPGNTQTVNSLVTGMFSGRILYEREQRVNIATSLQRNGSEDQTNLTFSDGRVRIKIDPSGAVFLAECNRITLDNTIFYMDNDTRPHGLFTPQWVTFYFKRTQ